MKQRKCTPKQEKFCLAYMELGTAADAYRKVTVIP